MPALPTPPGSPRSWLVSVLLCLAACGGASDLASRPMAPQPPAPPAPGLPTQAPRFPTVDHPLDEVYLRVTPTDSALMREAGGPVGERYLLLDGNVFVWQMVSYRYGLVERWGGFRWTDEWLSLAFDSNPGREQLVARLAGDSLIFTYGDVTLEGGAETIVFVRQPPILRGVRARERVPAPPDRSYEPDGMRGP